MRTTDRRRRLQKLFDLYNRRYFGGRLPAYKVRARRLPKGTHGYCIKTGEEARKLTRLGFPAAARTIWIDPRQLPNERAIRGTLLHELCHIRARSGHGHKFYAEMMNHLPDWAVDYEYRSIVGMTLEDYMLENWQWFASSPAEVAERFRKPKKRRNNDNSRTEK